MTQRLLTKLYLHQRCHPTRHANIYHISLPPISKSSKFQRKTCYLTGWPSNGPSKILCSSTMPLLSFLWFPPRDVVARPILRQRAIRIRQLSES